MPDAFWFSDAAATGKTGAATLLESLSMVPYLGCVRRPGLGRRAVDAPMGARGQAEPDRHIFWLKRLRSAYRDLSA